MGNNTILGKGSCVWATPVDFYNNLNDEFHFTLDPCSNDENHKCDKYFTVDDDGLSKDWSGETVYMNPPYGRGEIDKWVKKASEESAKENTQVVALIPASTDTRWFHEYVYNKAKEIRFVKGRLKFGNASTPAPFGSMVVVF